VAKSKAAAAKPRLGRPPASDSAETRRRILDIARRAFAARGYDAATNRLVGAEAGITAGAIYYYFGSKLDLYVAVHDDVQRLVLARFEEALKGADSFRGKFERLLDEAHELNKEDPSLAQFLASGRVDMRRNEQLRVALAASARTRQRFFDRVVAGGLETGEIDPADRETVSAVVTTILVGLNDAVSDERALHRRAIEGIKALIGGSLLLPAA
jgi:AcrR family transcriptional regulator